MSHKKVLSVLILYNFFEYNFENILCPLSWQSWKTEELRPVCIGISMVYVCLVGQKLMWYCMHVSNVILNGVSKFPKTFKNGISFRESNIASKVVSKTSGKWLVYDWLIDLMECYATPWPLWRDSRILWHIVELSFAFEGMPLSLPPSFVSLFCL